MNNTYNLMKKTKAAKIRLDIAEAEYKAAAAELMEELAKAGLDTAIGKGIGTVKVVRTKATLVLDTATAKKLIPDWQTTAAKERPGTTYLKWS